MSRKIYWKTAPGRHEGFPKCVVTENFVREFLFNNKITLRSKMVNGGTTKVSKSK